MDYSIFLICAARSNRIFRSLPRESESFHRLPDSQDCRDTSNNKKCVTHDISQGIVRINTNGERPPIQYRTTKHTYNQDSSCSLKMALLKKIFPLSNARRCEDEDLKNAKKASTKQVHFGEEHQNIDHEDEGDFSKLDRQDMYFAPQELFQIKRDVMVAKQLYDENRISASFDWRGLEAVRDGKTEDNLMKRKSLVGKVLRLQRDLQKNSQQNDTMENHHHHPQQEDCSSIRVLVKAQSKPEKKLAVKRGKQDEKEAKKILYTSKIRRLLEGVMLRRHNQKQFVIGQHPK